MAKYIVCNATVLLTEETEMKTALAGTRPAPARAVDPESTLKI